MRIQITGDTLRVSEVPELVAARMRPFRRQVLEAFTPPLRDIEIDLAGTEFLDSCGLGALIGLYKQVAKRNGRMRLLNPQPPVMQVLELTRMHHLFEICLHADPVLPHSRASLRENTRVPA